jgi:hypothetical protein
VRQELTIVDSVVRKGFWGGSGADTLSWRKEFTDDDDDGDHSLPCMRVLTTSKGKVATQPITPATPPEIRRAGHESDFASEFIVDIISDWSLDEGDEKYRCDNSYLFVAESRFYRNSTRGCQTYRGKVGTIPTVSQSRGG